MTGAKAWRQKGTGRARVGALSSPQRTGGGVAFGPKPRGYAVKVNRKAHRRALRAALSLHAERETIAALDPSSFDTPSTKAAAATLAGPVPGQGEDRPDLVDDIRQALYASKVVAYAQGFAQMRAASKANDWNLDLGAMATIWRGGCIIRAQFLNRIRDAYAEHGDIENLLMVPYFTEAVANAQDAWRRVVVTATEQGVAIPAFASSLSYYDGYRRERGPANLIQGLRDFFGAHTYRRTDVDGVFHTRWAQDGSEVRTDG
jgi:6-phosphogluconate dehydrogenase